MLKKNPYGCSDSGSWVCWNQKQKTYCTLCNSHVQKLVKVIHRFKKTMVWVTKSYIITGNTTHLAEGTWERLFFDPYQEGTLHNKPDIQKNNTKWVLIIDWNNFCLKIYLLHAVSHGSFSQCVTKTLILMYTILLFIYHSACTADL